ncbi:hypothetical protein TIFTF001_015309 [Ficus carica]|uniref:Uncharacterized protein n=1 Tax=Ficus carica TaxID=3494 RepID=A0AA88D8U7_FICCA|nr:hypothetical protein TIFTF001_015309 [Ficus carica]
MCIERLEHLKRHVAADERLAAARICWLETCCSGPFIRCSLQLGSLWLGSCVAVPVLRAVAFS